MQWCFTRADSKLSVKIYLLTFEGSRFYTNRTLMSVQNALSRTNIRPPASWRREEPILALGNTTGKKKIQNFAKQP